MSQQMTPDDLWVRRLQDRADEVTPDVPADAGVIVRRGRRRRTTRRAYAVAGGCPPRDRPRRGPATRPPTQDLSPAVVPEDHEVVIDTTDGTITLPLDRYALTETERAEVLDASALAMHACAADRGYVISDRAQTFLTPWDGAQPDRRPTVRGVVDAVRGKVRVRPVGRHTRHLRGRRGDRGPPDRRAEEDPRRLRPHPHGPAVLAGRRAAEARRRTSRSRRSRALPVRPRCRSGTPAS